MKQEKTLLFRHKIHCRCLVNGFVSFEHGNAPGGKRARTGAVRDVIKAMPAAEGLAYDRKRCQA
jgi:hypothetical protein